MKLNLSALDVVPVFEGENAKTAIDRSLYLAQQLEKRHFKRFLVAEHHNLGGTASSSTSNIVQYILSQTKTIRVGAGGVMLPNHSPLQVAETYGTLDALFPGRVDLGIGRAPGTDQATASLITRKNYFNNQDFADDIILLEYFFKPLEEQDVVGAYPGAGADVQLIILGSTVNSAYVAAALGLIYAFAGHINPHEADQAIQIYRERFQPSEYLSKPYVILGTWLFAADTDEKAKHLHSATQRSFLNMAEGKKSRSGYPRPVENYENQLTSSQKILLTRMMGMNVMGSLDSVIDQLKKMIKTYQPNEIIGVTAMSEKEDILKAYEILQEAAERI